MDQLPVAIRLLLAGLIDGPASVFVGATGGRNISFAASSPAGELAAPSHKTMSQTTWYQNRGPATVTYRARPQRRQTGHLRWTQGDRQRGCQAIARCRLADLQGPLRTQSVAKGEKG